ncbi:aminotransferase class V-fold PLP-dependent enzyme [Arthrobacter sp. PAMC25284]|uniref:aminotransferase class V-fold PLP-dependent enzyme n=1 Tax=Arthrobacter sp. PAMC25284 TaxID=2861279 RepID=UPI001C631F0A|nr:aminotransferase class V-fold PLP-dependent enzyme [Arthrobacter sp. PAMC25284]QYF91070.1 aminotransferase class V-fold PLP-dependent enzyme [Arthrobacter sp. PAMC25284]
MTAYLDYAATTPVSPRVEAVVSHYMREEFGNAGSRTHTWGNTAKKAVAEARSYIARSVGVGPDQLIFTSGATESNNIALLGLAAHGRSTGRMHIVTSATEHKAVLEPLEHLAKNGFDVDFLKPQTDGSHSVDQVMAAVRENTLLVSLMHVNNETGVVQPVEKLAKQLSSTAIYFHVDAAQSFGKVRHNELAAPIDMVSFSGHKIGGPKGIGGLIIRRRGWKPVPLQPLMFGGGQERKLRPGTLPVPLVMGLCEALRERLEDGEVWTRETLRFRELLSALVRDLNGSVNGAAANAAPHILNVSFPGVDSEALVLTLQDAVGISTGSACTSASYAPSHVLEAMSVEREKIDGSIRFSWWGAPSVDLDQLHERIAALQH